MPCLSVHLSLPPPSPLLFPFMCYLSPSPPPYLSIVPHSVSSSITPTINKERIKNLRLTNLIYILWLISGRRRLSECRLEVLMVVAHRWVKTNWLQRETVSYRNCVISLENSFFSITWKYFLLLHKRDSEKEFYNDRMTFFCIVHYANVSFLAFFPSLVSIFLNFLKIWMFLFIPLDYCILIMVSSPSSPPAVPSSLSNLEPLLSCFTLKNKQVSKE